jgi:hypothetical protein
MKPGESLKDSLRINHIFVPLNHPIYSTKRIFLTRKMPRERYPINTIKKLQKQEHYPAPKVGKTFGHGLDQGFNPAIV